MNGLVTSAWRCGKKTLEFVAMAIEGIDYRPDMNVYIMHG